MNEIMTLALAESDFRQNWATESFRSVYRRGFHDIGSLPVNSKDSYLATQFVRLVEEYFEWQRSQGDEALQELADICIVAANMAALVGVDVADDLHASTSQVSVQTAMEGVARAMRSVRNDAGVQIQDALRTLVQSCGQEARFAIRMDCDFAGVILAKLDADEQRGRLHGGAK
jgi:hypothetical protein